MNPDLLERSRHTPCAVKPRTAHGVCLLLSAAAFAGCGPQPAPPPPADAPPTVAAAPAAPPPVVVPAPPPAAPVVQPVPAAVPFRFADDRAGRQLAKALAPAVPPAPPLPTAGTPAARTADADRGEPPLPKPRLAVAPLPPPARKAAPPTPPPEGVPADLAVSVAKIDRLPEVPLSAYRGWTAPPATAADVPPLAKIVPDKAPTDDPTADLSAARIVATVLPVPALAAPFLKLVVPDPFELAEQVRPREVPELGTAPVAVPPGRPDK